MFCCSSSRLTNQILITRRHRHPHRVIQLQHPNVWIHQHQHLRARASRTGNKRLVIGIRMRHHCPVMRKSIFPMLMNFVTVHWAAVRCICCVIAVVIVSISVITCISNVGFIGTTEANSHWEGLITTSSRTIWLVRLWAKSSHRNHSKQHFAPRRPFFSNSSGHVELLDPTNCDFVPVWKG